MNEKIISVFICFGILISFSSCRDDPESSLVVNKDIPKMIEEASVPGDGKVTFGEMTAEEHYTASVKNSDLGVTMEADAKVDIPDADRLSVYRMEQADITQETVNAVRAALLGGTEMYEGAVLDVRIKSDVAEYIALLNNQIEESKKNPDYSENQREAMVSMYQGELEKAKAEYDCAPEKVVLTDHPSYGVICRIAEKAAGNVEDGFYSHLHNFNENGDVLYEVSDGTDGEYISFYMQNDEKHGNSISYRRNPLYYESNNSIYPQRTSFTLYDGSDILAPDNFIADEGRGFEEGAMLTQIPGESVSLSRDEAEGLADGFLSELGIDGFELYEGDVYSEPVGFRNEFDSREYENSYREYYILRYYRIIDGVFVTQSSTAKEEMADPGSGGIYTEYEWPTECIEFRINDSGIVGFDLIAPVKVTETVVENAYVKDFDSICTSFEKMIPVVKASTELEKHYRVESVRLSYGRISIPDSYTEGIFVPVWDFSGTYDAAGEDQVISRRGRIFSINAIDGSIIAPDLGY